MLKGVISGKSKTKLEIEKLKKMQNSMSEATKFLNDLP